jgi:UDP:flavonoid glycosyltransferase YjiC (YdhE family)
MSLSHPSSAALRRDLSMYAFRSLSLVAADMLREVRKPLNPIWFRKPKKKPLQRRSANMRKHQKIRKLSTIRRIRIRRPNSYTQLTSRLAWPLAINRPESAISMLVST